MGIATTFQDIYASIGYLFYSIAASDGKIAPAEKQKLKQQMDKHWLPLEDSLDDFGTDSAHYITISFDFAMAEEMDADRAFQSFRDQYRLAPERFTKAMKELVLKTAYGIADAFYGTNKAEQQRLGELKKMLN